MPSQSPPFGKNIKEFLRLLGKQIYVRRRMIKVSAVSTAEAAGISRMTLNRIERGEASVTMGAYINVIFVLGLELSLIDVKQINIASNSNDLKKDSKVSISRYPQLKKLAWQINKKREITLKEALSLYERNWRHIDIAELNPNEQKFIQNLLTLFGKERLLV